MGLYFEPWLGQSVVVQVLVGGGWINKGDWSVGQMNGSRSHLGMLQVGCSPRIDLDKIRYSRARIQWFPTRMFLLPTYCSYCPVCLGTVSVSLADSNWFHWIFFLCQQKEKIESYKCIFWKCINFVLLQKEIFSKSSASS